MSDLKPGTLCVIIAGCPENIGLVVEVMRHIGPYEGRSDAYEVCTVTGRPFNQLWSGDDLIRGTCSVCITDRHKLRPLVQGGDDAGHDATETERPRDALLRV